MTKADMFSALKAYGWLLSPPAAKIAFQDLKGYQFVNMDLTGWDLTCNVFIDCVFVNCTGGMVSNSDFQGCVIDKHTMERFQSHVSIRLQNSTTLDENEQWLTATTFINRAPAKETP